MRQVASSVAGTANAIQGSASVRVQDLLRCLKASMFPAPLLNGLIFLSYVSQDKHFHPNSLSLQRKGVLWHCWFSRLVPYWLSFSFKGISLNKQELSTGQGVFFLCSAPVSGAGEWKGEGWNGKENGNLKENGKDVEVFSCRILREVELFFYIVGEKENRCPTEKAW